MSADQREADALKPCPFCGHKQIVVEKDASGHHWNVQCEICCANTFGSPRRNPIAAWNARAPLAPEVEALIAAAMDYGHSMHAGLQSEIDRDHERVEAAKRALFGQCDGGSARALAGPTDEEVEALARAIAPQTGNDPDSMAADGVTVAMAWEPFARAALSAFLAGRNRA